MTSCHAEHSDRSTHPTTPHREDGLTQQLRAAVASAQISQGAPLGSSAPSSAYPASALSSGHVVSGPRRSESTGTSVSPVSTFSSGHLPGLDASPDLGHNPVPLFDTMPSGYSTDLPSPDVLLHLCVSLRSSNLVLMLLHSEYRAFFNVKYSPTHSSIGLLSSPGYNCLHSTRNTRQMRFFMRSAQTPHFMGRRQARVHPAAPAALERCMRDCAWPRPWKMQAWEDGCSRPYRVRANPV